MVAPRSIPAVDLIWRLLELETSFPALSGGCWPRVYRRGMPQLQVSIFTAKPGISSLRPPEMSAQLPATCWMSFHRLASGHWKQGGGRSEGKRSDECRSHFRVGQ